MRGPFAKAEPAELMAAATSLGAYHVVAALVLLDGLVALRALLRVGPDPTDVLGLGAVLDGPLAHQLAVSWPMSLFAAAPAPDKGAMAAYVADLSTLVLASELAAFCIRAPLHRGIVIDVRPQVPLLVLLHPCLIAALLKELHWHHPGALVLRAACLNRGLAVVHLGVQVPLPTVPAEAVATVKGNEVLHGRHADRAHVRAGCRGRRGGRWRASHGWSADTAPVADLVLV
mmetsp:Transcript_112878/g.299867  ORF Transcript_112878/g.299867 Transcript_112878/m.299867 type:complete len:230 (+) Transcript_112878:875-1564(+)